MLGFWALGQYALGQPGTPATYVVEITFEGVGCFCLDPTIYLGPPLIPATNIVRTGPGEADNTSTSGGGIVSNLTRTGPGRTDNIVV